MTGKKSKGKRGLQGFGSALLSVKKMAVIPGGRETVLGGGVMRHSDADFIAEGPTMEEILVSLEGLLDEDGGKPFMGTLVVDTKQPENSPDQTFPLTSVKGFESDANLEQELMDTLAKVAAYDADRFPSHEEDYVDLDGLHFDEATLLASHATHVKRYAVKESDPLDLSGMEITAPAPETKPVLQFVPQPEPIPQPAPEPISHVMPESVPEIALPPEPQPVPEPVAELEPDLEPQSVAEPLVQLEPEVPQPVPEPVAELEPDLEPQSAREPLAQLEPEAPQPVPEPVTELEPEVPQPAPGLVAELGPELVEPRPAPEPVAELKPEPEPVAQLEPEPQLASEPAVQLKPGPEPQSAPEPVAELEPEVPQLASEPVAVVSAQKPVFDHTVPGVRHTECAPPPPPADLSLTPELLRTLYGEYIETTIKEVVRTMLQELLPTILEEVIREELERIKRG